MSVHFKCSSHGEGLVVKSLMINSMLTYVINRFHFSVEDFDWQILNYLLISLPGLRARLESCVD